MLKLSVITINYNNCRGLRRTLQSVAAQSVRNFQYIVIDGGSTDGSADLIKEYEQYIDYWVSEPDKGIYNAMNKGVAQAKGEYCNFLNSGDAYTSPQVVQSFLTSDPKEDIIIGAIRGVNYTEAGVTEVWQKKPHTKLTSDILFTQSVAHQSSFIKTKLLQDNPYDETLRIVSDWKFILEELIIKERSYSTLPFVVVDFDLTGVSMTNGDKLMAERDQVLKTLFPPKFVDDYLALIKGRTPLNRLVNSSKPDGFIVKTLTVAAQCLSGLEKILRPFRRAK